VHPGIKPVVEVLRGASLTGSGHPDEVESLVERTLFEVTG